MGNRMNRAVRPVVVFLGNASPPGGDGLLWRTICAISAVLLGLNAFMDKLGLIAKQLLIQFI